MNQTHAAAVSYKSWFCNRHPLHSHRCQRQTNCVRYTDLKSWMSNKVTRSQISTVGVRWAKLGHYASRVLLPSAFYTRVCCMLQTNSVCRPTVCVSQERRRWAVDLKVEFTTNIIKRGRCTAGVCRAKRQAGFQSMSGSVTWVQSPLVVSVPRYSIPQGTWGLPGYDNRLR